MSRRLQLWRLLALATGLLLLVSACGGNGSVPNQPGLPAIKADPANTPVGAASGVNVFDRSQRSLQFIVITHGQASDPFWAVVQNGAKAAGRQLGVSVTYEAPDTSDVARMNQLINAAITSKPAGLVVSLPNPTALSAAVHKAEQAGIPVISINSGADAFRRLGTLVHVGQDEYQAGFSAGERMRAAHVRDALCVIHEAANLSLRQRCRGFAAALAATGAHTSILTINLQDAKGAEQSIAQALKARRYNGLLTLGGASIAGPTLKALQSDHLAGKLTYATFGIGPQVLRAVEAGQISFAADQQPYLQGYLPIVMLTEYRLYGVLPDQGRLVSTGPVFITKKDAAHVLALVNQGVR